MSFAETGSSLHSLDKGFEYTWGGALSVNSSVNGVDMGNSSGLDSAQPCLEN